MKGQFLVTKAGKKKQVTAFFPIFIRDTGFIPIPYGNIEYDVGNKNRLHKFKYRRHRMFICQESLKHVYSTSSTRLPKDHEPFDESVEKLEKLH